MKNCIFGTFLLFVFLLPGKTVAQNVKVTAGMGIPELLNLGLSAQFKQSQLGFAVGTYPEPDEDIFTLTGNYSYHFGGISQYTTLRPWFGKVGLTYLSDETEWERQTLFMLVPKLGREFNLSPKFGIALEAGIALVLSDKETVKKEQERGWFDFDLDFTGSVFPSAGVNLFYRF
jgi:hypothetical protein